MNLRCLNCHNPKNSDTYVNHDGTEIPSDSPTMLCAKCHGPHYREWTLGVHGRINGFWNDRSGEQKKLECVQCHDPHKPRFPVIAPQGPPPLTRFHERRVETHDDVK
jgi:pyruvate-formate lyase-activating enzyme